MYVFYVHKDNFFFYFLYHTAERKSIYTFTVYETFHEYIL